MAADIRLAGHNMFLSGQLSGEGDLGLFWVILVDATVSLSVAWLCSLAHKE